MRDEDFGWGYPPGMTSDPEVHPDDEREDPDDRPARVEEEGF